jgi:hypothetical protein
MFLQPSLVWWFRYLLGFKNAIWSRIPSVGFLINKSGGLAAANCLLINKFGGLAAGRCLLINKFGGLAAGRCLLIDKFGV